MEAKTISDTSKDKDKVLENIQTKLKMLAHKFPESWNSAPISTKNGSKTFSGKVQNPSNKQTPWQRFTQLTYVPLRFSCWKCGKKWSLYDLFTRGIFKGDSLWLGHNSSSRIHQILGWHGGSVSSPLLWGWHRSNHAHVDWRETKERWTCERLLLKTKKFLFEVFERHVISDVIANMSTGYMSSQPTDRYWIRYWSRKSSYMERPPRTSSDH